VVFSSIAWSHQRSATHVLYIYHFCIRISRERLHTCVFILSNRDPESHSGSGLTRFFSVLQQRIGHLTSTCPYGRRGKIRAACIMTMPLLVR